jgi:PAS domain S-box-containing protein
MVVEDEGIIAEDIRSCLLHLGYEVCAVAAAGEEAIRQAEAHSPDLVLMDIVLQGSMDGIDAGHLIRFRFNIPIVYLTAYADDDILERAKVTEPVGYIVKPFEERALEATISTALYQYKTGRRRHELKFRQLLDTAPDAIVIVNREGIITTLNQQAEQLFGYSRKTLLGQPLEVLLPGRFRDAHVGHRAAYLAEPRTRPMGVCLDLLARRRDGSEFPVDVSLSFLETEEGTFITSIIRDITERKLAEKRQATQLAISYVLAESGTLAEAAPQLLKAVCDIAGWDLGAMWLIDHDAGLLRCADIWSAPSLNAAEFAARCREMTFARGVGLPGRVWANAKTHWIPDIVVDPNFPRAPFAAQAGLRAACGFPIRHVGAIHGIVEFFSRDVREPDGHTIQMMAEIGLKVSEFLERKQVEEALHTKEEELRQSQKIEAVGRLAGGIAHDFNNLLTVINGYSQLLLGRLGPDAPDRAEIEEISTAGGRAAALTRQLLAFSRKQVLQPRVLELNAVVTNMERMLRPMIGEDIELYTVLQPQLGRVLADPGQIEQVLMNLAVNARDAMPQGGRLTIETSNVELNETYARRLLTMTPGPHVLLAVSDTGCGMDKETQEHIFEPFFTTKEQGKGTGLGLSTVYGIVKQSGGSIWVYSEPGRGTTFKIYLPRVEEPTESVEPDTARARLPNGTETILLVEDEAGVRSLARASLQVYGYRVLEAANGDEAIRIFDRRQDAIHLLVTDMVMPGMDGRALSERLSARLPGLKVLYLSGYAEGAIVHNGVLNAGMAFLQKPFTPLSLARKVRAVLDGKP